MDIDAALIAGTPCRAIARQFGPGRGAIERHAKHAATVTEGVRVVAADRQKSVLERVRELGVIARRALDAAGLQDPSTPVMGGLDAMRELGRLLELEARITGELAPKKVDVTNTTEVRTPKEALAFMERLRPALEQAARDEEGAVH